MTAPGDDPHDPHLQAALRHAPDHDLAPPPALSARILAQARQAAGPARPVATGPGWIERWFGWMSRPVAAGAFGTILIAGFVGLMWRGGPPPEALPGADQPAAATATTSPVPGPAPVVAAPSAAADATPAAGPVQDVPRAKQPHAVVGARSDAPARQERPAVIAAVPATAQKPAESSVAGPAAVTAPAPALAPAPAPAPPLAPPTAAAPQAAPAPTSPLPAVSLAPMPAPTAAAPSSERALPHPASVARDAAANAQRTLAAPPAPAAARLAAATVDPLAPALLALSAAADSAWRDRLLALRNQTQGRWVAAEAQAAEMGDVVTSSGGQLLGRLRVDAAQAIWQGPDGRAWRALLPAAPAAAASR